MSRWKPPLDAEQLASLVARWQETRNPRLADLIEAWGSDLETAPTPARTSVAFHAQWLEVAGRDPVTERAWLARTIDEKLKSRSSMAPERNAVLVGLPHDPRVATGLLGALQRARLLPRVHLGGTEIDPVYATWIDHLVALRDVRVLPALEALLEHPIAPHPTTRDVLAALLPPAIEALRAVAPVEIEDLPPVPEPQRSVSLDAVYDAPHDLELRAALADQLQEQGDPRGTFIALQLAGLPDTAKQERALLRAHRAEWLGPELDAVLANAVFVNGFLDRATLARRPVDDQTPGRAAMDPRLSTVTHLGVGSGFGHQLVQLLESPHLRSLRSTEANKRHVLTSLTEREPLEIATLELGFPIRDDDLPELRALTQWPRLDTLLVPLRRAQFAERWAVLERSGLLHTLSTVWVTKHPDPMAVFTLRLPDELVCIGIGTPDDGILFDRPQRHLVLTRPLSTPKLTTLAEALGIERITLPAPKTEAQKRKLFDTLAPVRVELVGG